METVAEAVERNAEPSSGPLILPEVEITSEPTPVYAELRQLFLSAEELPAGASEDEEIRRFAKQLLDRSQQALLHAWALKHFVARFSPEELRALQPEARAKWFSLIREHARGFRQETELLRQRIEPIFFPGASSREKEETKVEIADDAELGPAVERLFQMSAAHDEALRSAFVISVEKQTLGKIKSKQFRRSLIASEGLAMRIESGAGNAPR